MPVVRRPVVVLCVRWRVQSVKRPEGEKTAERAHGMDGDAGVSEGEEAQLTKALPTIVLMSLDSLRKRGLRLIGVR